MGSSQCCFPSMATCPHVREAQAKILGSAGLGKSSLASHLFCPSVSPPSPFWALHMLFPLLEMILNQAFPEQIPSGLSYHVMSKKTSLGFWLHSLCQLSGLFL